MHQEELHYLNTPGADRLAYRHIKGQGLMGKGPAILWLGGFMSDMLGTKAQALAAHAQNHGWDFLCFDYFAHGATGGDWSKASVGRWQQNMLDIVDHVTAKPLIVIGSSMGGWMAALLIKARPQRILSAGFIAPAADFTTELMLPNLSPEDRLALAMGGYQLKGYERDLTMTSEFFNEASQHIILGVPLAFSGRVRIVHGMQDEVVPWQHGLRLAQTLTAQDIHITLIKDGDHRLSRPQDLDLILAMAEALRPDPS
jgi:pimeloyl-ACP methyl ester carboxylesterase